MFKRGTVSNPESGRWTLIVVFGLLAAFSFDVAHLQRFGILPGYNYLFEYAPVIDPAAILNFEWAIFYLAACIGLIFRFRLANIGVLPFAHVLVTSLVRIGHGHFVILHITVMAASVAGTIWYVDPGVQAMLASWKPKSPSHLRATEAMGADAVRGR